MAASTTSRLLASGSSSSGWFNSIRPSSLSTRWSNMGKWKKRGVMLVGAGCVALGAVLWYPHASLLPYRHQLYSYIGSVPELIHQRRHGPRKKALLQHVHGKVLEIGPRRGYNFQYYTNPKYDNEWTGIEPNTALRPVKGYLSNHPSSFHFIAHLSNMVYSILKTLLYVLEHHLLYLIWYISNTHFLLFFLPLIE
jgi:hypothetical protein